MKRFFTIALLLLFSKFLFGTTYHTITIDGVNDFDADEQFNTTSGNDQTGYVYFTWDENNIYVGFSGNSGHGNIADDNRALFLFIDVDPQTNPLSGNGTNDRGEWSGITGTIPFNADFRLVYQTTQSGGSGHNWLPYYWDGSTWAAASIADNSAESGDTFVEYSVSRSDLGNPTQIYICAYSQEQWDGGWIATGIPSNLFDDFVDDNSNHDFNNHWLGFTLTSGVSPNNSSNNDNSLPVTLNSFTTSVSTNSVVLQWTTQSEIDVLGYEIQRALAKEGPFETIATYRDHAELRATGSTSARTDYRFEDNDVLSGFTYWYKLISHDLDGSQQSFGPIAATLQKNDQGIKPITGATPDNFELKQNFPNPFNNSTQIIFSIPQLSSGATQVQLNIYNLQGKRINTLVNQKLNAGSYQVNWNGKDSQGNIVPSGVYIYQLKTSRFISSKKMLLIQ